MLRELREQPEALVFFQSLLSKPKFTPLLLVGNEGVGRRFAVYCFARASFCAGSKDSTCTCTHCTQLIADSHPDLVYVHSSKAIGVDTIREAIEVASEHPSIAKWKFLAIEGAESMTVEASNALLKILEEPPETTRFFLLATSVKGVLPTIASRCWVVPFRRLPTAFIIDRLSVLESDPKKAEVYAKLAGGSLGRAIDLWGAKRLKLRDKVLNYITECISGDVSRIFSAIDSLTQDTMGLYFLEHILCDSLLYARDVKDITNKDIVEQIGKLSEMVGFDRLSVLWASCKPLLCEKKPIDLNFHLKSAFVRIFV